MSLNPGVSKFTVTSTRQGMSLRSCDRGAVPNVAWQSSDGYIYWIANDTVSWGLQAAGLGPDSASEISARPIPTEPMVSSPLPAYNERLKSLTELI